MYTNLKEIEKKYSDSLYFDENDIKYSNEIVDIFNGVDNIDPNFENEILTINKCEYLLSEKEDFDEATRIANIGVTKKYYKCYNVLGCIYVSTENNAMALKSFKLGVKHKDNCAAYSLGCYYRHFDDSNKARKYFMLAAKYGNKRVLHEYDYAVGNYCVTCKAIDNINNDVIDSDEYSENDFCIYD